MVWGLFPVDPIPGEDKYYFFNKGTYKVGRKGCDVIVNKDKGVSRVHAEIVIEEMIYLEHPQKSSDVASKVRIRDCSKYGTFINKNLTSKEKVHEFPNRETMLKDGDLVSFGTGSATYRFSFVPLVFFICSSDNSRASQLIVKNISSIGAGVTRKWSSICSHVLVEDSIPLKEGLVDAIVARKPFVQFGWVELIAGKNISTDIPSCDSHAPTLKLEGVSVKVAVPEARGNCLKPYTFVLDLIDKYKLKDRLLSLLEVSGAKVSSVEDFCPNSQGEEEENDKMVYVIPAGSTNSQCFHGPSLSRVNEMDLVAAAVSGHLDPSLVVSPPVLVTSSCSTDETVVADSDAETESGAESGHDTAPERLLESADHDNTEKTAMDVIESTENKNKNESSMLFIKSMEDDHKRDINLTASKSINLVDNEEIPDNNSSVIKPEGGRSMMVGVKNDTKRTKISEIDNLKSGNSDIIFSQELIIREHNLPASVNSSTNGVANFKRFRKTTAPSGNSFNSLIPFSKYPYKASDYDNEEVVESIKEEKRRKQMESRAEDLFKDKDEKKKRRGVVGSLLGVLARG